MGQCRRCGSEVLTGHVVCPHCGLPQRRPRLVRCRNCGRSSRRGQQVCPSCGERLRSDWRRPVLAAVVLAVASVLGVLAGPPLYRAVSRFRPEEAVEKVQAVASQAPRILSVPTLTPTLTPTITPTPSPTLTPTPTPSLTPTPTQTPTPLPSLTPVPTVTPAPTATRVRATATARPPAVTPTPTVALPAPVLAEPENGAPFDGAGAVIKFVWKSEEYWPKPDECFLLSVYWTERGAPARLDACTQQAVWFLDPALYLRADQETGRLYRWDVRLARKGTGADGQPVYTPIGPPSATRSFTWK